MEQNNKPENPPAFPNTDPNYFGATDSHGMDLRDYFAGLAMQSLIIQRIKEQNRLLNNGVIMAEVVAKESYQIADAMLTERQKDK